MKCPKCGRQNPEGTVICSGCDAILDKSFLGGDFTDESGAAKPDKPPWDEDTAKPAAGDAPAAPPSKPGRRRPSSAPVPAQEQATERRIEKKPVPKPAARSSDGEPTAPRKEKRSDSDTPPQPSFAPRQNENLKSESARMAKEVEGTLKKGWSFFLLCRLADKLSIAGGFGVFVFVFFPWVTIPRAEVFTGFELGGWFAGLLGIGTIVLVWLRLQPEWLPRARYVLYGQLAATATCLIYLLTRTGTAKSVRFSGADMGMVDNLPPVIGAGLILCLGAAIVALAGTLMLYKDMIRRN
jgi:hypothetical protein